MNNNFDLSDKSAPNVPDYENNLAFPPKMTWDTFVDYVLKNFIAEERFDAVVIKNIIACTMAGDILINCRAGILLIAENRSFEQMQAVLINLFSGSELCLANKNY